MNLSYYFEDLSKAYNAELEDLHSDSEGNDVLARRLKDKRAQFTSLLPMIDTAPEMVAVAFHGAMTFNDPRAMVLLSMSEPNDFPEWSALRHAVELSSTIQPLTDRVLEEPAGERFLITAVCLEFLHAKVGPAQHAMTDDAEHDEGENGRDDDDEETDLDEAGATWMTEQGFDRRD